MIRKALMLVPLGVLMVVLAVVLSGCSSDDAPPVVVSGAYDAEAGPLTPTLVLTDAKGTGPQDQILLMNVLIVFTLQACFFRANYYSETDGAAAKNGYDIDLEGTWEQHGNVVTATFGSLGADSAQAKNGADGAAFQLLFTADDVAAGTVVLDLYGYTYEGGLVITGQPNQ